MFNWLRKKQPRPAWRITQDSHSLEYHAERLTGNWAGGSDFYCATGPKSLNLVEIEAWIEAEQRNHTIVKEIP